MKHDERRYRPAIGEAGSAGVFATALKDNNDKHATIEEPGNCCTITNPASYAPAQPAGGVVLTPKLGGDLFLVLSWRL